MGVLSWMRYVNDTFDIVENKGTVEEILKFSNNQHKNIIFTVEFDEKHFISFLDVRVKEQMKVLLLMFTVKNFFPVHILIEIASLLPNIKLIL